MQKTIKGAMLCLAMLLASSLLQGHPLRQNDPASFVALPDSVRDDTLRSVIVTADGRIPVPVRKPAKPLRIPSLSDLLGAKLTDQIMHPFAFSERKRERHRRKMMKILKEYDLVETPREQLLKALRAEGINVDSLLMLNAKKAKE